jgi:hypothetical protein
MVDHTGSIILESYVYVNPQNVIDWQSDSKSASFTLPVFQKLMDIASGIRPGDLDGGQLHHTACSPS